MNEPELIKRFPNASKSFLAANSSPSVVVESSGRLAPLATQKGKGQAGQRFLVRVESVRKRLLDQDNLCEKYLVDLCRYAGVIPGDAPGQVEIETRQRKAGKDEQEHTTISVIPI